MQASVGIRFLAIQRSKPGVTLPYYRFSLSWELKGVSAVPLFARTTQKRTRAEASGGTDKGRPRYAVVGGGFAGVAAAWHLLALTGPQAVDVDLFDVAGIAGGASGAAAGLLHPFSPKGKLLWRGEEAMAAAVELLAVANAHRERILQQQGRILTASKPAEQPERVDRTLPAEARTPSKERGRGEELAGSSGREGSGEAAGVDYGAGAGRISWAQPLLRPAADARQAAAFSRLPRCVPSGTSPVASSSDAGNANTTDSRNPSSSGALQSGGDLRGVAGEGSQGASVRAVGVDEAAAAVPGLPEQALRAAVGQDLISSAALWIEGSHVVHPERYLRALWGACEESARSSNGHCRLLRERVTSLQGLEDVHGPYTAVIVAAGAAAGTLPEIGDRLPMELCQGYTLDLAPPRCISTEDASTSSDPKPDGSGGYRGPSLLGSTYLAAQGSSHVVVGATKRYGLTGEQALQECGRPVQNSDETAAAAAELVPRAAAVWPPVARWEVVGVRSGVRALPPRSAQGSLPLAGKLEAGRKWWVVAGLGARGLVYHAWLGRLIADAVLTGDESVLPGELRMWQ